MYSDGLSCCFPKLKYMYKSLRYFYKLSAVSVFLLFFSTIVAFASQDTTAVPKVFVMEIKAEIDPRMNRYTQLALEEAMDRGADYIIIEMDTYGGALNDADDIRTRIMEFEKPVYVFINKDAASAGALISIACDSIYMAPGASIGAATVVTGDGEAAPDKYQSYMRSIMRSTAEAGGRDPKIAEAMVDQELEVEGISDAGQIITFSTSEAIDNGFCEGEVRSIAALLEKLELADAELSYYQLPSSEKVIAFFLNPFVSSILILLIIGGLYFELQTPGIGFPLIASLIALTLYFTPYYLNGIANYWELILFFVGVGLIAVEVFVIPGFGVAGISGIILSVGSLALIMINNDALDFTFVPADEIVRAIATALAGLMGSIILMFVGGARFAESKAFQRIALQGTQRKTEGYTSTYRTETMIGKIGTTYTVLRPSGKILVDDIIYDASTLGNYIARGVDVVIIDEEGSTLKVKERQHA